MPNINLSILNQKSTPAFFADTLANRPAPSFVGRVFISTDTLDLYRDTGSAWDLLSPSSTGGVTGSGSANSIAFWNGTSSITYDVKLTYDSTTDTLYVGDPIVSSGKFIVNNNGADDHIVIIGANAPSFRINNGGVGATQRIGFGIATSPNNFIQGSVSGDMCVFNSSTTPSPILFGIWNGVNTQEGARLSTARNFLIGQSVDTGEKLQVTGDVRVIGNVYANNIGGGGAPVMPTFTFTTSNGQNPGYVFDNYKINSNINGVVESSLSKTGLLTFNSSNFNAITGLSSDVEILTQFQPNITNVSSLSLPNLVCVQQSFQLSNTQITDYTPCIPSLLRIGGTFSLQSHTLLTNLNFNNITYVGALSLSSNNQPNITSVSFNSLTAIGNSMNISQQSAITTFNFPSLVSVFAQISITNLTSLVNVAFINLRFINNNNNAGALSFSGCGSLFSVILPNIERIYSSGGSTISFQSGTPNLTVFGFGSNLKQIGNTSGDVLFQSCSLSQSSVDGILISLAALDGTNGTTSFNNRTIRLQGTSATPSATGLAAKATLQARGNIVFNN